MIILLFLYTIALINCGHIFIDDMKLTYQNIGYVNGLHIYFSLESGLESDEILAIKSPLNMSAVVPYFLENEYTSFQDLDTESLQSYSEAGDG